MPSIEVLSKLEGQLCKLQPALCVNILAAICGYNPSNLDQQRLPTYVNYTPSGTSVQNMAHWSQVSLPLYVVATPVLTVFCNAKQQLRRSLDLLSEVLVICSAAVQLLERTSSQQGITTPLPPLCCYQHLGVYVMHTCTAHCWLYHISCTCTTSHGAASLQRSTAI
jgi:hypothetical protein